MSKELPFLIFCIEEYKNDKNMDGKEVVKLFNEKNVFSFIQEFYESLHTMGKQLIVADIDEYIKVS